MLAYRWVKVNAAAVSNATISPDLEAIPQRPRVVRSEGNTQGAGSAAFWEESSQGFPHNSIR